MLPSIAAPAPAFDGERHRLHYAARALLDGMADARPLLLVLDDVHWADTASLELIAHLTRRPPDATLLVLAYRKAPRALRGERIVLEPLTRADADRCCTARPPPTATRSTSRAAATRSTSKPSLKGSDPLSFVADELDALSPAARTLAQGAAVAAEPFGPELAAAAAELDDPLGALDELLAADLVRATDTPRRFRFRHPIVRQAIYAAAGAGWRLGAHARVEAVLARQGAAAAQRAHHLEQCAEPGDANATDVLAQARRGGGAARAARRRQLVGGRAAAAPGRQRPAARAARPARDGARRRRRAGREPRRALRGARTDRRAGGQGPGGRVHRDDRAAARPSRRSARAADRDARGPAPRQAGRRAAHRAGQGALLRRRLARDAPLRRGRAGGGAGARRPAADRLRGRHPGAGRVPPAGRRRRPAAARRGRRPARRADRRPARRPAGRGPVRRLGRAVPGPLGRRPPPLRARARASPAPPARATCWCR